MRGGLQRTVRERVRLSGRSKTVLETGELGKREQEREEMTAHCTGWGRNR